MLAFIVLVLFLFATLSIIYYSVIYGITPMPSSWKARKCLFENLPDNIEGAIYELGAGWGTLAFPLARRYPNCRIIAYEISFIPWLWMIFWKFLGRGPMNLTIIRGDFLKADWHEARMIVCYLYPKGMMQLGKKLDRERKSFSPDTLIISNTFSLPGWTPTAIHQVQDMYNSKFFVYTLGQTDHEMDKGPN